MKSSHNRLKCFDYPIYYGKKTGLRVAEKRAKRALFYAFFSTTRQEKKQEIIDRTRKYLEDYPDLFDNCYKFVEQRFNEIQRNKLAKI